MKFATTSSVIILALSFLQLANSLAIPNYPRDPDTLPESREALAVDSSNNRIF
ncbi:hypothetical protein H4582DRAFT_2082115 [Lactarius indigo]|nr:hypothetical protein H4582DRAFT_2085227 [Lactarius indigo]KAI9433474.1 hypothetical protein H4582DRAFT_2082115 [Lactarius indigo]